MRNKIHWSLLAIALLTACGNASSRNETATPPLIVKTATLPPTVTARPTETPLPPPATSTFTPVEAVASTQVNVRAEPNTTSEVLGILIPNARVQVIGKDPGGNWWFIEYPPGIDGKAWVVAQYVLLAEGVEVPVIGGGGSNPNDGNVAIIQQKLNVRSGPGTSYNSLGTLNPKDVVPLTGKDSIGAWLQIEFPAGPDGKGWINAAFVQAKGVENLPIVTDAGQVLGTGTPANTPLPPTPTIVPAPMDNDSAQAPVTNIVFSATGTQLIQYSNDISAPGGDTDDWIQFTPYTQTLLIEIDCLGNGSVTLKLLENNQTITQWEKPTCGTEKLITTSANRTYLLHIHADAAGDLNYTQYTIKITSIP